MKLALRHPIRFVLYLLQHRSISSALWLLDYDNAESLNVR